MPYAVQPGDIVVPSYWPNSGWRPWPENPAFEVAELPHGSLMFQALSRYIQGNIQARSFRAKKAERTRMQRAEAILKDTSGKYNVRWKQSADYRLKEKSELGGTTPPPSSGPVDVAKILIIKNEQLWERYENKRYVMRSRAGTSLHGMVVDPRAHPSQGYNTLRPVEWTYVLNHPCPGWRSLPVLDALHGEVLMFHGTTKDVIPLIAAGGFDPNRCQNRGKETPDYGLLGKGSYFTDSFSKLMVYTGCNKCGDAECACNSSKTPLLPSNRYSMMCRVLLGSMKRRKPFADKSADEIRQEGLDSLDGTLFDSVMGIGPDNSVDTQITPTNEFIIKDPAQANPEFIIYWRRRRLIPSKL
jgi:hypothetical protein